MRYQVTAISGDTFGLRDTHPCGDSRAPLWRVDSRAAWLAGSAEVAGAYAALLNAEESRFERTAESQCKEMGCARQASYDGESGGYFSTCDRCSGHVGYRGHAHAHGYWAAYIKAHPGTSTEAYMRTSQIMRPIITDDVVTGYRCADYMCGYTIDQPRYEARTSRWYGGVHTWGVLDHVTAGFISFGDEPFNTESETSARFMADALNG